MIGVDDLPRREGDRSDGRGRGGDRLSHELGLEPDDERVGPAVEEELIDRLGDIPEEGRLGVEDAAPEEAAEPGLVVGEAEQLDRRAESLGLERVRVADEDRHRRRGRGDRVGRAWQLFDIDARIGRQDRHGSSWDQGAVERRLALPDKPHPPSEIAASGKSGWPSQQFITPIASIKSAKSRIPMSTNVGCEFPTAGVVDGSPPIALPPVHGYLMNAKRSDARQEIEVQRAVRQRLPSPCTGQTRQASRCPRLDSRPHPPGRTIPPLSPWRPVRRRGRSAPRQDLLDKLQSSARRLPGLDEADVGLGIPQAHPS